MSVGSLVSSGPLLLAIPVAAAAGAVTFLSPCVLPLVPGYLSYITGMSGVSVATGEAAAGGPADPPEPTGSGTTMTASTSVGTTATAVAVPAAARPLPGPSRRRAVTGAALFVLGFSALFATYGAAFGSLGALEQRHAAGLSQILGVVLILLGLLFAGAFDRFSFSGRIVKPSLRPKAGLASAPLLGVLFGLGWSPCIGPTLGAVLTLGLTTGTAARGAILAFVYGLGVGIPFLIVAFAVERGMTLFGFARRHARLITKIGGLLLIAVGLLEVTGAWSSAMLWLKIHWLGNYNAPF
ncbi:MAG TPA: cytochrome c biogenesis protein CcdA [Streptosporangiaceae bacterium]|nr:cytochrome c biogenesis protein CcdA [Streptosporangiaceae bacterium]